MPRSSRSGSDDEKSLGRLYSQITVEREIFDAAESERKLEKRKLHPFVQICKRIYAMSPGLGGKNAKFKPEFKEAIEFLDWPLKPEELSATVSLVMIASIVVFLGLAYLTFSSLENYLTNVFGPLSFFYVFAPAILATVGLTYWVQNYPLEEARAEQVKALTYVPELMGYMIMSMKLVPNLEKSVEFSAEHGRGKIAEDFKKLLWDVELGVYNTLSEGLDALALRWGKYSSEFKESLMMVRASVLEDTEAKRYALLDKTMSALLESVKTKMEQYARDLSQPSISLFYLGVLLPLILIIILPVGSAFSGQALARTELLVLVYNIGIPAMAFVFALNVIKKRPPTYEAPKVPDNHPLLPPKWSMELGSTKTDIRFVVALVLVFGLVGSFYLHSYGLGYPTADGHECFVKAEEKSKLCLAADKTPEFVLGQNSKPVNYFDISEEPSEGSLYAELVAKGTSPEIAKDKVLEESFQFFSGDNDVSPQVLIFGLLFTLALVLFVYFYYANIYRRKIQLEAMRIEGEFKEALYILASRMGENKPVEDAMKHVRDFLPTYKVSTEVFGSTVHNIEVMGMPLSEALFDPTYGSLKNNPSTVIRSSMKIVVDSVQLGVDVASRTIASLSLQLSNQDRVSQNLKVLISDVSQMMRLMSTFVGPAILGVTVALQRVVMSVLANVVSSIPSEATAGSGAASGFASVSSFTSAFSISPETMQALVTPSVFLVIVAVYVIEIVFVLMYFTSKIEEDNDTSAMVSIAKSLPVAVIVFLASAVLANMVVSNIF